MKRILLACIMFAGIIPACVQEEKEPTLEEQIQDWIDEGNEALFGTDTEWEEEYDTNVEDQNIVRARDACAALRLCERETYDILEDEYDIDCYDAVRAALSEADMPIAFIGECLWTAFEVSSEGTDCARFVEELYLVNGYASWLEETGEVASGGCLIPAALDAGL